MADRTDRVELSWCDGVFHPPVTVPTYDVELAEYIAEHCGPRHKRFYDSARWLHLRARVIADAHGASLYELAQSPSRYVPATVVHHVMRVDDYPGWALSEWSERRMGVLRGDLSALTEQIGDAGSMIERVSRGLGDVYADVLEAYYIDAPDDEWARGMRLHAITWAMVADDLGLSEDAARKRRDRACSWLDMSA